MTKNKNCDINMRDIWDRFSTVTKKVPQRTGPNGTSKKKERK